MALHDSGLNIAKERQQPESFSIEKERSAFSPELPADRSTNLSDIREFFLSLSTDAKLQTMLIKHFDRDVLVMEISERGIIEPLMNCEQLAKVLDISLEGLYKKLQKNELGIPYFPIGRGGGYKFDPRDVKEYIKKHKVYPIVRQKSLTSRKARGG